MPEASGVVWYLAGASVPLIIRDDAIPNSRIGHLEQFELSMQAAAIDQRTEIFSFDKINNSNNGVAHDLSAWTGDMAALEKAHADYPDRVWNRYEIAAKFKTLTLVECNINILDEGLTLFKNLKMLDVSSNILSGIGVLPPNLVGLTMNSNPMTRSCCDNAAPCLRYLSLAYCDLAEVPGGLVPKGFPELCALDLSGNNITSFEVLESLAMLPKLTHLALMGNPMVLISGYRKRVLDMLPGLIQLDDISNEICPHGDLLEDPDQVVLRITITSLTGLAEADSDLTDACARIHFKISNHAGSTEDLPWTGNLITEVNEETASLAESEASKKNDNKKGKGKNENPEEDEVKQKDLPKVVELRIEASSALRDSILFEGIEASVWRVSHQPAEDADKDSEIFAKATVNIAAFLEPSFYSRGACTIHEILALEPGEGMPTQQAAEMKISIELNPEDTVLGVDQDDNKSQAQA